MNTVEQQQRTLSPKELSQLSEIETLFEIERCLQDIEATLEKVTKQEHARLPPKTP